MDMFWYRLFLTILVVPLAWGVSAIFFGTMLGFMESCKCRGQHFAHALFYVVPCVNAALMGWVVWTTPITTS